MAAGVHPFQLIRNGRRDAIAVIRTVYPGGSTVFEIGCGTDIFLRARPSRSGMPSVDADGNGRVHPVLF